MKTLEQWADAAGADRAEKLAAYGSRSSGHMRLYGAGNAYDAWIGTHIVEHGDHDAGHLSVSARRAVIDGDRKLYPQLDALFTSFAVAFEGRADELDLKIELIELPAK